MFLTLLNGMSLIAIGLAGVIGWERLGPPGGEVDMFMPIFYGVSFLICAGFSKVHQRHGLYGGLIMAILGVVSAIIRLHQYEGLVGLEMPKTQLIAAMGALCMLQVVLSWRAVQADRNSAAPHTATSNP